MKFVKTPLRPQMEEAFEILVTLTESRGRLKPVFDLNVIRKLREGGLIAINHGKMGGAYLSRPPEDIHLSDIYQAVEGDINASMESPSTQLNLFLNRHLKKATLADFLPEPKPAPKGFV